MTDGIDLETWPLTADGEFTDEYRELPEETKAQKMLEVLEGMEPEEEDRPIDYVLVYRVPQLQVDKETHEVKELTPNRLKRAEKSKKYRDWYLGILKEVGFQIKEVPAVDGDMVYVHLYAPMRLLVVQAERQALKMMMRQESQIEGEEEEEDVDEEGLGEFSSEFKVARYPQFDGMERPMEFFTPAMRSLLTRNLLVSIRFYKPRGAKEKSLWACCGGGGDDEEEEDEETMMDEDEELNEVLEDDSPEAVKKRRKYGITALTKRGVFSAWYPLHNTDDSDYGDSLPEYSEDGKRVWVSKKFLLDNWAKTFKFWKLQPMDEIRDYFGEKIALYFAWLEFYTWWLWPVSILGLVCFIVALGQHQADGKTSMDSVLTIPFTLIMALWATLFLEFWKRKSARLAYLWDTLDYEEGEMVRPEFYGEWRISEITGEWELVYPEYKRYLKYAAGSWGIVFMLCLVLIAAFGILLFRAINVEFGWLAGLVNAVCIVVLNIVYQKLAFALTNWENHRTETDYEDNLIVKTFMFQFINSYITLFYIAFFKGNPGISNWFAAQVNQTGGATAGCSPDCVTELATQLGSILITKQIIGNFKEVVIPYLKYRYKLYREMKEAQAEGVEGKKDLPSWEIEMQLPVFPGTFDEYNEMIIQFGYVTLFVAAFPLAPLCGLINNLVEVRSDAFKLLTAHRRPAAVMAEDIGSWQKILEVVGVIAVITNGLIVTFTSEELHLAKVVSCTTTPASLSWQCGNTAAFWIFILVEHVILFLKFILAVMIPDVDAEVRTYIAKEQFQMKKALEASEGAGQAIFSKDIEVYDPDNAEKFQQIVDVAATVHTDDIIALYPPQMGGQAQGDDVPV